MFYTAIIHDDSDGVGFSIPDLPGFAAHVQTSDMDDAVREAERVLRDYLAAMNDNDRAIPKPAPVGDILARIEAEDEGRPLIMLRGYLPAGRPVRVNLSLDEATLARIDQKATVRGLTRSAFLAAAADAMD